MIGIIVTGHGNFATGMTSSVKLIAGMPENYQAVDFCQEDSTDDLEAHLRAAVDQLKGCQEGILIFSDLVGGSPFKISVELSVKLTDGPRIVVLSGTNLGMLIETSMARGYMTDLDALADMAVNTGKTQAMKYEYVERKEEEQASDGI